jgi:hypothetical protein
MLSSTAPALAAEQAIAATNVSAKSIPIKHRRMTSIRRARHVPAGDPLQAGLGCSGEWCGRQFVLMVGIGY